MAETNGTGEITQAWVICPKCGEQWNRLKPGGLCFECTKKLADQKQATPAKDPAPADFKTAAAGEEHTEGTSER